MTVSFNLNAEDMRFVEDWAAGRGMSVSDLARCALLERAEEEMDLRAYHEARAEYEADPVTYSLDEIEKDLFGDGVQG